MPSIGSSSSTRRQMRWPAGRSRGRGWTGYRSRRHLILQGSISGGPSRTGQVPRNHGQRRRPPAMQVRRGLAALVLLLALGVAGCAGLSFPGQGGNGSRSRRRIAPHAGAPAPSRVGRRPRRPLHLDRETRGRHSRHAKSRRRTRAAGPRATCMPEGRRRFGHGSVAPGPVRLGPPEYSPGVSDDGRLRYPRSSTPRLLPAGHRIWSIELELPNRGHDCASCVARIERFLKKTPGVEDANVNLATERQHCRRPDDAGRDEACSGPGSRLRRQAAPDTSSEAATQSLIAACRPTTSERDRALRERSSRPCSRSRPALAIMILMFSPQTRLGLEDLNRLVLLPATAIQFWAGGRFLPGRLASRAHGSATWTRWSRRDLGCLGLLGRRDPVADVHPGGGRMPETYFDSATIIIASSSSAAGSKAGRRADDGCDRRLAGLQATTPDGSRAAPRADVGAGARGPGTSPGPTGDRSRRTASSRRGRVGRSTSRSHGGADAGTKRTATRSSARTVNTTGSFRDAKRCKVRPRLPHSPEIVELASEPRDRRRRSSGWPTGFSDGLRAARARPGGLWPSLSGSSAAPSPR